VFLDAFLLSFGVIFVAELGDKSQLMALTFATRYPALPVLGGIGIATAVVHALSVTAGVAIAAVVPPQVVTVIAALAFFGFALWTLRGDSLSEDEAGRAGRGTGSAVLAASIAFFLAELGDKTMLATITLATQHDAGAVWAGSTAGMVVADALAIGVGRLLGSHLPERLIQVGSAIAFAAFGALLLYEALA
jgi:putative Ca2+/H+ antiporter (TMEM165/GDT1 family)